MALHPGVAEVGAIGVPDERSGEAVMIVVARRDIKLNEQSLLEYCRQQLTGYKVPRFVEFRTEPLPKSALGKTLRRELRKQSLQPQALALREREPGQHSSNAAVEFSQRG